MTRKEQIAAANRRWRARVKAQGRCPACGQHVCAQRRLAEVAAAVAQWRTDDTLTFPDLIDIIDEFFPAPGAERRVA